MKTILPTTVSSIAFIAFRFVNDTIMDILLNHVKSFNIAGLANLELDIMHVFDFCGTALVEFDGI
jgi:Exocyst complex subunit Sec15-like.